MHCAVAHGDLSAALTSQTLQNQGKRRRKAEDDILWAKKVMNFDSTGVGGIESVDLQPIIEEADEFDFASDAFL